MKIISLGVAAATAALYVCLSLSLCAVLTTNRNQQHQAGALVLLAVR